jgi:hypothetical protein
MAQGVEDLLLACFPFLCQRCSCKIESSGCLEVDLFPGFAQSVTLMDSRAKGIGAHLCSPPAPTLQPRVLGA